MIAVRISGMSVSNMGYAVVLEEMEGERSLLIFIGAPEAHSIALSLENVQAPRPLSHDLLVSILNATGIQVERVEVHDLKEDTFYAHLYLQREAQEIEVDSRPSDAIAIAVRVSAPIFVTEEVMDQAGVIIKEEKAAVQQQEQEEAPPPPEEKLSPRAVIQRKLESAVKEERYEDAAKLRDELKKFEASN